MNVVSGDDRWASTREAIEHNTRGVAVRGGMAGAVAGAVSSLLAPVGVGLVAAKLVFVVGPIVLAMAVRMGITSLAIRQVRHRGRRTLLRWLPRLLWLLLLPAWTVSPVPVANVIVLPLIIVGFAGLTAAYSIWTMERERSGAPPHGLEWGALMLASAAAMAVLVLTLMALAAVGFAAWWAGTWLSQ